MTKLFDSEINSFIIGVIVGTIFIQILTSFSDWKYRRYFRHRDITKMSSDQSPRKQQIFWGRVAHYSSHLRTGSLLAILLGCVVYFGFKFGIIN